MTPNPEPQAPKTSRHHAHRPEWQQANDDATDQQRDGPQDDRRVLRKA
jgi:hypothetical protein